MQQREEVKDKYNKDDHLMKSIEALQLDDHLKRQGKHPIAQKHPPSDGIVDLAMFNEQRYTGKQYGWEGYTDYNIFVS